jgi:hypothetical protein
MSASNAAVLRSDIHAVAEEILSEPAGGFNSTRAARLARGYLGLERQLERSVLLIRELLNDAESYRIGKDTRDRAREFIGDGKRWFDREE